MDDKLDRVLESLQQVAVSVESLRVSLNRLIDVTEDHEQRLRRLETWRNNLTPVIAVSTFVLGSLFNAFLHRLQ
ncbi:hypothetical protein GC163_07805 [bacterium]|nr:hypothetical protein [bacterium]